MLRQRSPPVRAFGYGEPIVNAGQVESLDISNAWKTHVDAAVDAACQLRKEAIDLCLTEPFDAAVQGSM